MKFSQYLLSILWIEVSVHVYPHRLASVLNPLFCDIRDEFHRLVRSIEQRELMRYERQREKRMRKLMELMLK